MTTSTGTREGKTIRRYSAELREQGISLVLTEGLTLKKAAALLSIPVATLGNWTGEARRTLSKGAQHTNPTTEGIHPALHRAVRLAPEGSFFLLTQELADLLRCDSATILRACREKGYYEGIRPYILAGRHLWPIEKISEMLYAAEKGAHTP